MEKAESSLARRKEESTHKRPQVSLHAHIERETRRRPDSAQTQTHEHAP